MRRPAKLWETSDYWKRCSQAVVRHAHYKERPDVWQWRIWGDFRLTASCPNGWASVTVLPYT